MNNQSENPFVIGPRLLLTLTTGMYTNSFVIYREFIQNAADSIDDATRRLKIMESKDASIQITIDKANRRITIEDNASGISETEVPRTLGGIGNSQKDLSKQKGFIGVGRLAALGYCRRLIFETKYCGENVVSTVVFDADKLKSLIANKTDTDEARDVLEKSVTFSTKFSNGKDFHYFKVIMEDILPSNEELLDEEQVIQYLRQVAPVKFSNIDFEICADKIEEFITKHKLNDQYYTYKILVNGQEITKGYSDKLPKNDKITDVYCSLLKIPQGGQEKIIGWYWFGIRQNNDRVLVKDCWQRYIRLRKGNIQIGEADCLDKLWKQVNDERANHFCIGEVHVLVSDLIPNGRRDYFEENESCRAFEETLKRTIISETGKIYRGTSTIRGLVNDVVQAQQTEEEIVKKLKQDGITDTEIAETPEVRDARNEVKRTSSKLEEKRKKLDNGEENSVTSRVLSDYHNFYTGKIVNSNSQTAESKNVNSDTSSGVSLVLNKPYKEVEPTSPRFTKNEQKILKIIYQVLNEKLDSVSASTIYDEISRRIFISK